MKIRTLPIICAAVMSVVAAPACAQSTSEAETLRQEMQALKEGQEALRKDLAELREILGPVLEQLPKPFRPQKVTVKGSPSRGSDDAKVTVVEFTDLQCPYCVRYYENTFPKIVENYVDTGKVRYVSREFPLTTVHKEAQRASQAALCAGEQDKYWEVRDKIFRNRAKLSDDDLTGYAEESGVDTLRWRSCMETDVYVNKVRTDLRDAARLGIQGTPSFVIGLTDPDNPDSFTATKLLPGAYPYEEFEKAINGILETAGDAN